MASPSSFSIFLLLLLAFSVSHGALTFQEYWNLKLPHTPMPAAVSEHIVNFNKLSAPSGPVTFHSSAKPLLFYSYYGDGDDSHPSNGAISVHNRNPMTVDSSSEPLLFNSKKIGKGVGHKPHAGVISGVNGEEPVTFDSSTKPLLFYSYYGDGDDSRLSTGVKGEEPVTFDSSTKPILFYSYYGDGDDSRLNKDAIPVHHANPITKPLLLHRSRKATVGTSTNLVVEPAGGLHPGVPRDINIDNPKAPDFFLEKDLRVGAKMKAIFNRGFSGDRFLHRELADTVPFSSREFPEILRRFAVRPGSLMAKRLADTIRMCESPAAPSEKKLCATSLESMVDFVTSSLGTNDLQTLTTVLGRDAPEQVYTVQSWVVVPTPNSTSIVCHPHKYPYTIFHCHWIPQAKPYVLKMVGGDGTTVDAAAVCHADNSEWSPTFYALQAFQLRPGETTVCHLIPQGDIIWFPRVAGAADAATASV